MRKIYALTVVLTVMMVSAMAQMDPMAPIPADKDVRIGKLDNGMTYYIRHNTKPENQADFYILHDVGAIQEADDQQGLAHFLEHMAFNGTKNLPGKTITEYLETVGVKFGANLNAGTSWDYTEYQISNVPTTRQGVIDTALLILHDWSQFISLEEKEIDSERGVIKEELRTRDGANWRSTMNLVQTLYKGSKYEERNLIGYLDYLESFPYSSLKNFYKQWYRPDYQAIVVVGDIDVDKIEAQIKTLMSDIPAASSDASKKELYTVPSNVEPIISIFEDKEMTSSSLNIYIKQQAMPKEMKNSTAKAMMDVATTFISTMQNARLQEIAQSPDSPFIHGYMFVGNMGINPTLDAAGFGVGAKDGGLMVAYEAMATEIEKIQRYGFTQSEFERAQKSLMNQIERKYTTRDDRRNGDFVKSYSSNFYSNTAIPDAKKEFELDSMFVNMLNVEVINRAAKQLLTDENQVIIVSVPTKEGLATPTKDEILAIYTKVIGSEVEAYVDDTVIEPLIGEDAVLSGSVVEKTVENQNLGTIEWTLANGAKVIIKSTDFKADEILLNVESQGGQSILTDAEYYTGNLMPSFNYMSGVSKFSSTDLKKQLTGKTVSVHTNVDNYTHGLSGFSSPKDLEAMLQLVYLNFTAPRFTEADFNTAMNMIRPQVENIKSDPNNVAYGEYQKTLYSDNYRRQILSTEILDAIKYDDLAPIYEKLYPGANGFTFTFVGNINIETLKPLVETYIGSIPAQAEVVEFVDDKVSPANGKVVNDFKTPMQQPKVNVSYAFTGEMKYNLENSLSLSFLKAALDSRYLISVREEKGGTYGVGVGSSTSFYPEQRYILRIVFDTNEEMADELSEIIVKELEIIAANGPLSEDIEKNREYLLKTWQDDLKQNNRWMSYITSWNNYGIDYMSDYENVVTNISGKDIQKMAKKILKDGNMAYIVMRPEATTEAEVK